MEVRGYGGKSTTPTSSRHSGLSRTIVTFLILPPPQSRPFPKSPSPLVVVRQAHHPELAEGERVGVRGKDISEGGEQCFHPPLDPLPSREGKSKVVDC